LADPIPHIATTIDDVCSDYQTIFPNVTDDNEGFPVASILLDDARLQGGNPTSLDHQLAAMASFTQSSLQPSRAAPPAPQRRATEAPLTKLGYANTFPITPPSPSVSSYHTAYSGIGGSPNIRGNSLDSAQLVRTGWSQVKEDGFFSQWNKRWLVLKEQSLFIQRSEVRNWK
jgi:hypothetical protein